MDITIAAHETTKRCDAHHESNPAAWPAEQTMLGYYHVRWMLMQIALGKIVGEKAHRWLGWAQAAAVAAGAGTLEDMKQINHRA